MSLMTLDELENGIKSMPPLPAVVSELTEMIDNDDIDLESIERNLSKDSMLAGRVLSVANSPFYGMAGKIGSLNGACRILGTHTIRNIIISAAVAGQFVPTSLSNINHAEIWRHAASVAAAARVFANKVDVDPNEAFTAGLLHDIGKLGMDHFFPEHYGKVIAFKKHHQCLLVEAENEILGVTHSDAGAVMAEQWKLPESIVTSIRGHHQPYKEPEKKLSTLIYVADTVSRALDDIIESDSLVPIIDDHALERIGISTQQMEDGLMEIARVNTNFDPLLS